jgi:hypothetical protein
MISGKIGFARRRRNRFSIVLFFRSLTEGSHVFRTSGTRCEKVPGETARGSESFRAAVGGGAARGSAVAHGDIAADRTFQASPALFVTNQGQWDDPSVRFVHQGDGANVAMTDAGPVFQLSRSRLPGGAEVDLSGEIAPQVPPGRRDLHVQFHHVFVVQDVIAFDLGPVVNGGAPDAGEFELVEKILVDHARHLQ